MKLNKNSNRENRNDKKFASRVEFGWHQHGGWAKNRLNQKLKSITENTRQLKDQGFRLFHAKRSCGKDFAIV